MPQSFGSLHCHIVFSTKHRQPFISADWQPRLYEYIGGILRGHSNCLVAAGGMPDHIHLLVSMSRTTAVADGHVEIPARVPPPRSTKGLVSGSRLPGGRRPKRFFCTVSYPRVLKTLRTALRKQPQRGISQ